MMSISEEMVNLTRKVISEENIEKGMAKLLCCTTKREEN